MFDNLLDCTTDSIKSPNTYTCKNFSSLRNSKAKQHSTNPVYRTSYSANHSLHNYLPAFCSTQFSCVSFNSAAVCTVLLIMSTLSFANASDRNQRSDAEYYNTGILSMSTKFLRQSGERTLREGSVLSGIHDAIEFPVVHERNEPFVLLQYFIGLNRSLWLTITPCTNSLSHVQFSTASAYYDRWQESHRHGLHFSNTASKSQRWQTKGIHVEPFPGEKMAPNYTVSQDEDEVHDILRSRMHYSRIRYQKDTLNVKLYGNPGDAYAVRLSTRRSPEHSTDGYPRLLPSSQVSACVAENTSDTLDIQWNSAPSDGMKPSYCVVINAQENLYYRCTALALLKRLETNKDYLRRPTVYRETDRLRNKSIEDSVYQCTDKSGIRIKLPKSLASVLQMLGPYSSSKMYINVYAINMRVDLSTAYPVLVLQEPPQFCQLRRISHEISVDGNLKGRKITWNEDIVFEWPTNIPPAQLFYQPCRLLGQGPSYYTVHVYQKHGGRQKRDEEISARDVSDSEVFPMCNTSSPGHYRIHLDGNLEFMSGQPIARFFFLNNHTKFLPQRPAGASFQTRPKAIIEQSTTNQVFSRIPEPRPQQDTTKYKAFQPSDYFGYTFTTRWKRRAVKSRRHFQLHNESFKEKLGYFNRKRRRKRHAQGFSLSVVRVPDVMEDTSRLKIGVDCSGHQIYISLPIHTDRQYYWIYTIPLANHLASNPEWLFEQLNNVTNYCEFPAAAYYQLTRGNWRPVMCYSAQGQTLLRLLIPAYHRSDYPRYYLLLIYAASGNDPGGSYRELLVQQLIDACKVVSASCYSRGTVSCLPDYPSAFPANQNPSVSGYSILTTPSASQIPACRTS